jgi:hypothetical protein
LSLIAGTIPQRSPYCVHNLRPLNCFLCKRKSGAVSAIAQHIESGACNNISRHQVTAAVRSLNIIPAISIPRSLKGGISSYTVLRTIATQGTFDGTAYVCFFCRKTFRTRGSLNMHLNSPAHDHHQFKCPKCKRQFKLVSALIQHVESGACGIATFVQVADLATSFVSIFSKKLLK